MPNSADEIDFKIINSLSEDCRKTIIQIALYVSCLESDRIGCSGAEDYKGPL
jgi:DNA-binding Lrp family transcriptional regulator